MNTEWNKRDENSWDFGEMQIRKLISKLGPRYQANKGTQRIKFIGFFPTPEQAELAFRTKSSRTTSVLSEETMRRLEVKHDPRSLRDQLLALGLALHR